VTTKLRQVMEEQGRRHVWLAEQLGVSPSHVTRVMNGERTPGPAFRERAAAVLAVDEGELFADASAAEGTVA
jgi:transcriptional regulator with XRE-family HTH domain